MEEPYTSSTPADASFDEYLDMDQDEPMVMYLDEDSPEAPMGTAIHAFYTLDEPVDNLTTLLGDRATITDKTEISQQEQDVFYVREALYTVEDAVHVDWNQYENNRAMVQATMQGVPIVLEPDSYGLELVYTPAETIQSEDTAAAHTVLKGFNDLINDQIQDHLVNEDTFDDPGIY